MNKDFRIKDMRVYVVEHSSEAGTYFQQGKSKHWLVDNLIANPMSGHAPYRARRSSWGINALDSIVVELETESGKTGVATGSGGVPAAWIIANHFSRFIIGQDARNINLIWDQMYRSSLPYGRKGIPILAISAVDLALWDLNGKVRGEPVFNLIGGKVRNEIEFYCTGPDAAAIKEMGFWGAKVPLPEGPFDGEAGLQRNVEFLKSQRKAIGQGFPLMVDCYMSLDVPYASRLATACAELDIYWWEEPLSPEDNEGYRRLRQAHPGLKWTTGEHEYTRYGFRKLIEDRVLDILQPDVMWVGGLSETLRIAAHAGAYDIPIVPHGSGPYSYHFIASRTEPAFCEYVAASANGRSILPVFGTLMEGEPVPVNGRLEITDAPGFGMEIAQRSMLRQVSLDQIA